MSATPSNNQSRPWRLRLVTWLFPPAGLFLLWREPVSLFRKLLGTVGIALFSAVWLAGIIAILVATRVVYIEWQGGFPPKLTRKVTLPNYDALERDRAAHEKSAETVTVKKSGSTYWTDFRGPNRDGHYTEQPVLTDWPADGPKVLWRHPIGGGYASFVIAKGLAFTIEQRREEEAVTAYDMQTGLEVWAFTYPARFQESMGGEGPRATPTWHEDKLYALGAEGDLHCLDAATGKLIWKHNILTDAKAPNLMYAMAAAPLVVDDKVIMLPGGSNGHSVIAYDKDSGQIRWHAQDDKAAYTSPMLVEFAGQRQLLIVSATRVMGLTVEEGKLLWSFPWQVSYENSIAQPVLLGNDRFMLSAGYSTGSIAIEVKKSGDTFSTQELWRSKMLKNKFTSSVYYDGYVYGLDEDILTCIDAATGRRMWKDGRYEYGQVLLASGHLIVMAGLGDLALVKATPEKWTEVARVPLLNGKTWNHPAISEGKLLVRNAVEMVCVDLRPQASK